MPRFPAALSLCHPKSNILAKSYSLYSHLTSHLDKIHSPNYDQFQHTSQIILQCVYNNWWALPVILTICFFLPYTSLLRPSARRLASIASTPRWLPARSRVPTGHLLTPGVSVGRLPALKLAPPLSR
jgi:hypothetical protein